MKIEITKEEKQLICNALNYVSMIKQKQVTDFYRINSEEERLELLKKSDAYYDLMCKIEEQK